MMRPLAEMPRASLASATWLAFDVDDTVTENGRVHSRSLAAMEALVDSGVKLAAVTGRPLGWVEVFMHTWPISLGIGENGAGWFARRDGGVHASTYVPIDDALLAARARAREIGASVAPAIQAPRDGWARRCDIAFDIGESTRADPAEVEALDAALRAEGYLTVRSSIHLHAATSDWTKARGLVRAFASENGVDLDCDRDRLIFVGDSPNDASAFAHFPLSVGVANVREHDFAQLPRFVTREARSAGFAELATAMVSARAEGAPR